MSVGTISRIVYATILGISGKLFMSLNNIELKALLLKVFSVNVQSQQILLSLTQQDITVLVDETQFIYLNVEYA